MAIIPPRLTYPEPVVPLVEELTPTLDPWDAARRLAGLPQLLFLDSAATACPWGRYSFVTADPFDRFLLPNQAAPPVPDPFRQLAARLTGFPAQTVPGLPPFQGGAAGLFSYDLCHCLERLPRPRWDEFGLPNLVVGLYDWVVAFDHQQGRGWLISTGYPEYDPGRRRRRAERRCRAVRRWLGSGTGQLPLGSGRCLSSGELCEQHPLPGHWGVWSTFSRDSYLAAVRRAVDYVHAGDCFQVNIAQRLLAPLTDSPLEVYARLRERNPAPFAAYFQAMPDLVLLSASPERFLRVEAGAVETRPIKGTRPRGTTPAEDQARRDELLASAKDRAENVMIVDLLRNDLGRVCAYGSVRVGALCRLESYRYVHHLVSEVHGRLQEGLGPLDLLRAAFPGGSVTGAPKVRAMEIIAELEPTARGPYCGSLGYVGFDGTMDTNILIRTITAARGWLQFPVGGGIVADSEPQREYEETLHKAQGLLRALSRERA